MMRFRMLFLPSCKSVSYPLESVKICEICDLLSSLRSLRPLR
jgi:hypothetical protein